MTRDELAALRDAIDTVLTWPDGVRDQVARWLTPEAAKPNGLDPHPPPIAPTKEAKKLGGFPPPRSAKARRGKPPSAKTAEQRLLTAMRESPGLSVISLAKAVSAGRSTTGERLRQLAARGAIEKDSAGRWRLKGEEARRHCHAATDLRSFWSPGTQRDGEDQLRWIPVPAGDH